MSFLTSNTSSISIAKIGVATCRPQKVIGMHFMNPVPIIKLEEFVPGYEIPVEVNDYPGFVANKILMPMINEVIITLHAGVSSPESWPIKIRVKTLILTRYRRRKLREPAYVYLQNVSEHNKQHMRIYKLIILFGLLVPTVLKSQVPRNNVNFEFLGTGFLASLNYERIIVNQEKHHFTGSIGLGASIANEPPTLPLTFSYNRGSSKHFLKFRIGYIGILDDDYSEHFLQLYYI